MRTRLAGAAVLTVGLLAVPLPVAAGGWATSIQLDKEMVAVGETVTASATVMFASIEEAQEAVQHGGHHAYLVQGVDRERLDDALVTAEPGRWWTVPPTSLHLAELEFSGTDANLADVHVTFTVPDVEPGMYGVMFCSDGCAEPLADVVPRLDIPLHDDPVLARMVRSLETQDGGSRLSVMQRRLDEVYESVGALRRQLRTALEQPAPSPAPAPTPEVSPAAAPIELSRSTPAQDWLVVAGAFLAGATLAGIVLSLRQRRRLPPAPREPRVLVAEPESVPEPMASAPR